jgi:hypothetical protein
VTERRLPCRKCLIADLPRGEKLREILRERLAQIPEEEKVGEGEYRERLERCRSCGELREGTCALCGCYPELRLARKGKGCPKTPTVD